MQVDVSEIETDFLEHINAIVVQLANLQWGGGLTLGFECVCVCVCVACVCVCVCVCFVEAKILACRVNISIRQVKTIGTTVQT